MDSCLSLVAAVAHQAVVVAVAVAVLAAAQAAAQAPAVELDLNRLHR